MLNNTLLGTAAMLVVTVLDPCDDVGRQPRVVPFAMAKSLCHRRLDHGVVRILIMAILECRSERSVGEEEVLLVAVRLPDDTGSPAVGFPDAAFADAGLVAMLLDRVRPVVERVPINQSLTGSRIHV